MDVLSNVEQMDAVNPLEQVQEILEEQFRFNDNLSKIMFGLSEEKRFEICINNCLPGFDIDLMSNKLEHSPLHRRILIEKGITGVIMDRDILFTASNLAKDLANGGQEEVDKLYGYLSWKYLMNIHGTGDIDNESVGLISSLTGWDIRRSRKYWTELSQHNQSIISIDTQPLKQCVDLLKPFISEGLEKSLIEIKDITKIVKDVDKLMNLLKTKLQILDQYSKDPKFISSQYYEKQMELISLYKALVEQQADHVRTLKEQLELNDTIAKNQTFSMDLDDADLRRSMSQAIKEKHRIHDSQSLKIGKKLDDYNSVLRECDDPKVLKEEFPKVKTFGRGITIFSFVNCYSGMKTTLKELQELEESYAREYTPQAKSRDDFLPAHMRTGQQKPKQKPKQSKKGKKRFNTTQSENSQTSQVTASAVAPATAPAPAQAQALAPASASSLPSSEPQSSFAMITKAITEAAPEPEPEDDENEFSEIDQIAKQKKFALIEELKAPSPKKSPIVKPVKRSKPSALQLTAQIRANFKHSRELFTSVFADVTPHLIISFKELMQLVAHANGEVKPVGGSRFRIKLFGQFDQILAPPVMMEFQNSSAFVAHEYHIPGHKKGLAQSYVVQQFRNAFQRVGITPEHLWPEGDHQPQEERQPVARALFM